MLIHTAALQVALLAEMLNVQPWCTYPLSVQVLSSEFTSLWTGALSTYRVYMHHSTGCVIHLPPALFDRIQNNPNFARLFSLAHSMLYISMAPPNSFRQAEVASLLACCRQAST
jgi:hypothetical protein